ncbi:MAG: 50S ribosomal protein L25/general stress protein Ctc [Luteimonas sp.]|nr:50S ribosomal protein L25/general stress protein Ctc [Luteimonas sp.]
MAIEHKITATGRSDEGKGASRRLRHAAQIPAIVYGGHADPKSIQLEHEKTWQASQNEWFYSSILSLELDGTVEKVLLRDMQRHPYRQQIMHLDFQRVSENEAIRVAVPLHFLNEDTSPAGKAADVAVTHELNEVVVSCLPKNLPEYLEIDLGQIKVGDTIHLSEIKLPEGVEVPELKLGPDHDVAIAVARFVREEIEEEVVAEEGSAEVPAAKQDEDAAGAGEGEA